MKKKLIFLASILMITSFVSCSPTALNEENPNVKEEIILNEQNDDYVVTFETNGGTFVEAQRTNKLVSAPSTSKDNYYFDGWFLDRNLTNVVIYPMKIEDNITLYAKWVKIADKLNFENCEFKFMSCSYSSKALYDITPRAFNYNRLEELGYTSMNISVSYSVSYEKQYKFLWDIGYFGSPKYEVSISNDDCWGEFQKDIKTTGEYVTKYISINAGFDYCSHTPIVLKFSTNNIQNLVKVKDITVSYTCL